MAVMGSFHLVYFKGKLWEERILNVENFIPITRINELIISNYAVVLHYIPGFLGRLHYFLSK